MPGAEATPPDPEQPWSVASVREVLAQYGLAPARRAPLEVHPLASGTANLNLRVVCGGEELVLRRYATVADTAAVQWELELVRFLTARGFPTAPLLATPAGALAVPFTGRVAALFRFIPGRHPDEASLPAAEAVATAVAELHRLTAGATLPSARATPPAESGRRLTRFATLDLPPGGDRPLGALQQDVRAFRRALEARLAPVRPGLPTGVGHCHTNWLA